MIAVDSNILIYAHNRSSPFHEKAKIHIQSLANSSIRWGIPVPCVGEFLRVITHRSVFINPFTVDEAMLALDQLLQAPNLKLLHPTANFLALLTSAIKEANATSNLIQDAQIVAVCRGNGVTTLLTEDRDFEQFNKFTIKRL